MRILRQSEFSTDRPPVFSTDWKNYMSKYNTVKRTGEIPQGYTPEKTMALKKEGTSNKFNGNVKMLGGSALGLKAIHQVSRLGNPNAVFKQVGKFGKIGRAVAGLGAVAEGFNLLGKGISQYDKGYYQKKLANTVNKLNKNK